MAERWIYAWINQFFKRKIYDEIYEWKENRSDKYALLIKGARRVGKSTIAEEFAKKSLNRIFSLTLLIQVRQLFIISYFRTN